MPDVAPIPADDSSEDLDRRVADNTVFAVVVGSQLSGLATHTSDRDEMAVAVEWPESVFGGKLRRFETHKVSPVGHTERTRPGDVERVTYSLRKFLALASAGNTNPLSMLWAPPEFVLASSPLAEELVAMRDMFRTAHAVSKFVGYAVNQTRRLRGEVGQKNVKRPELMEAFGYDTKYAAHVLRLAYQGEVFARDGFIPQPIPEPHRSRILEVRLGKVGFEEANRRIDAALERLCAAEARYAPLLPVRVDETKVVEFSIEAHHRHWTDRGLI